MFDKLTSALDFQGKALVLRAERQRLIASNIANADTPGYVARDLDFRRAMEDAGGTGAALPRGVASHARHLPLAASGGELGGAAHQVYAAQSQPSMDGNSVDLDRERASFADNAVRYESTLRFINGRVRTLLSAIQGQ